MSKGKAIVDKALQQNNKHVQQEGAAASSPAKRAARDPDRQPTLIHWFLENPVPRPDAPESTTSSKPVREDMAPRVRVAAPEQVLERPARAARAHSAAAAEAEGEAEAIRAQPLEAEAVAIEAPQADDRFARLVSEKQELESRVSELTAEKQQTSDYRSSVLLGKEREIKQLRRQLADLESEVLRLNRILDQKDREAQAVAGTLRDRDAFLSALQRTGFFRRAFGWSRCFNRAR